MTLCCVAYGELHEPDESILSLQTCQQLGGVFIAHLDHASVFRQVDVEFFLVLVLLNFDDVGRVDPNFFLDADQVCEVLHGMSWFGRF